MNVRLLHLLPAGLAALALLTGACGDDADEGGRDQTMPSTTFPEDRQPFPAFNSATPSGLRENQTPGAATTATATATPQGSAPGGAQGNNTTRAPQQFYALRLSDQGITPAQVTLPQGLPVHLSINNSSQVSCAFYIGDYLTGLLVDAGTSGQVTFPVPAPSGSSQGSPGQITMGCAGNDTIKGQVSVQPAEPGMSGTPDPTPRDSSSVTVVRVTVTNSGVEPADVTVKQGGTVRVEIVNQGGPCRFYFADQLRGLLLPGGTNGSVAFDSRAPVGQGQPGTATEQDQFRGGAGGKMGCQGEPDREGKVTFSQP